MQVKSIAIGLSVLIVGVVAVSGIGRYLHLRDANSIKLSCLKNNSYKDRKQFCDFLAKEFLAGSLSKGDANKLSDDITLVFTDYPKFFDSYLRFATNKAMP